MRKMLLARWIVFLISFMGCLRKALFCQPQHQGAFDDVVRGSLIGFF